MKIRLFLFSVFVGAFLGTPVLSAAELAAEGTAARKFQRGIANMALAPVEISNRMKIEANDKTSQFEPKWLKGVFLGAFFTFGRACAGVYDAVTAPLPWPKNYAPLIYPEFPWDELPPPATNGKSKR